MVTVPEIFQYHAYGLEISSEIELHGFLPGTGEPDVTVRWESLLDENGAVPLSPVGTVTGFIPPDFYFSVRRGRSIVVHPGPTIDLDTARTHIQGLAIAALLRQRGLLVLHASCVARDGLAIVFAAHSGRGKSTMASYFHDHGYDVLSDDVTAIELDAESNQVYALKGASSIRLRPDAGRYLHEEFDSLRNAMPGSGKRIRFAERVPEAERVPVSGIFVLGNPVGSQNAVFPLTHNEALQLLVQHTHAINLLNSPADNVRHFNQIIRVLKRLPVRHLQRCNGLEHLAAIRHAVESELPEPSDLLYQQ